MNAKRLAAHTAAIAISATAPLALGQDANLANPNHANHGGNHPETSPGLVRDVRQATRRFLDVNAATAEGYVSTQSCVSGPNGGAMGVHYVNEALIADGVLDVRRPEVLVYEPSGAQLRLVAVEYYVHAQQWDAANAGPPVLGGQHFHYVGAPNRLRAPAYYELHVWGWKRNSSGTFSDWNPAVSCTDYVGGSAPPGAGH